MTSVVPSGKTARTSRARIDSFTFSLRFCLRGGKFLGGNICDYALDSEGTACSAGALRKTGVPAGEMTLMAKKRVILATSTPENGAEVKGVVGSLFERHFWAIVAAVI